MGVNKVEIKRQTNKALVQNCVSIQLVLASFRCSDSGDNSLFFLFFLYTYFGLLSFRCTVLQ